MIDKKGITWPFIIEIILVITIIFGVIYLTSPHFLKNTRTFINETGLRFPNDKDFVPYVPDSELPIDMQRAKLSVSVFEKALETVATGGLDVNAFLCKPTPQITGSVTGEPKETIPLIENNEPCIE